MKKIKKLDKKTRVNMTMVLDNLGETIERRLRLIEKYLKSEDPVKLQIAKALEDNVAALLQVRIDIMDIEKESEEQIFGD